jgi:hypothetical protein
VTPSAKTIRLTPAVAPRALLRPAGFKAVAVSVGLNGDAIRLLIKEELAEAFVAREEQPGWASFPKTHTESAYSAIASITNHSGSRELPLFGLTATFGKVEILPSDEILVVASRCRRKPDGSYEMNAKVYGEDGHLRREFLLGDGIHKVQTNNEGKIWVGYSDEGVYGNFGWQHPVEPIGACGLSCFNSRGQKLWDYKPPDGFDSISDCYAMNVCETGTWICYYTDFPIALIDSNLRVRCWKNELSGARAFAVGGDKILLFGGYGESRSACSLLTLGEVDAVVQAEVSMVFPRQVNLTEAAVIGRGGTLHVFAKDDWYQFSVDSFK